MSVRARFVESDSDLLSALEIDVPGTVEGVQAMWHALYAARVQVVSAELRDADSHPVERMLVCEFDGGPISRWREREIERAVASSLRPFPLPSVPEPRRPEPPRESWPTLI